MNLKSLISVLFFISTGLGIACLPGCTKSGTPVVAARNTTVELRAVSVDAFRLKVVENEAVLTDSLTGPDGYKEIPVTYYDYEHRYRVYNVFDNILLIDTTVTYKPGSRNGVTFFQSTAGGPLQWVGPPVNEALAPEGYKKISIIYTYAAMPEEVKVVIENSVDGGPVYTVTDSFILQKGAFSPYFQVRSSTRYAHIKMYRTDAAQTLVAEPENIVDANADFSIYLFRSSGSSTVPYNLLADKLY